MKVDEKGRQKDRREVGRIGKFESMRTKSFAEMTVVKKEVEEGKIYSRLEEGKGCQKRLNKSDVDVFIKA